jgi:PAS domain S-box-containing protein
MQIKDVLETTAIAFGLVGSIYLFFKWVIPSAKYFLRFILSANSIYHHFGADAGLKIKRILAELQSSSSLMQVKQDLLSKHLDLGIYVTSAEGQFIAANPTLCDLFGMDEKDFHGTGWLKAVKDKLLVFEHWKISRANEIPYTDSYVVINQRDGEEYKVYTEAYPVKTGDGTLLCYVGFTKKSQEK